MRHSSQHEWRGQLLRHCHDGEFLCYLKTECVNKPFASRQQARQVIFEYIEVCTTVSDVIRRWAISALTNMSNW
ncbi:MAG: IS3 family transposase [Anaerolineae bacterium]|nr:IS3 family transposase [Anaerolineae bacterium]